MVTSGTIPVGKYNMWPKLQTFFRSSARQSAWSEVVEASSVRVDAATALPAQPLPQAKTKRQAIPSYSTTVKMPESPIPQKDRRLANTDTTTFRNSGSTSKVLRDFAAASPELSAAIFAYLRIAIPSGYIAVAKNLDGSFNPEATTALQMVIARMDVLPDYTQGFSGVASLRSLSESLGKELLFEGACLGELVLDKVRFPSRIQPVSVSGLLMQPDKDNYLVPVQNVGGVRTVLDSPTIIYVALDQSLLEAYATSPLETAIKATVFSESFISDIQRVVKKAIHPRIDVTLDYEKFKKSIPEDTLHDAEKLSAYQNTVIDQITTMINDLGPEDALVHFDFINIDYLNNGNSSLSSEYGFISDIVSAKLASGAKAMPAVLGLATGSQNVASTESMLFVKAATGAITGKLNEFYSRIFTLAVRLMGFDVTVEFRYDSVDLRPDSELEVFKTQRQSRVLELLSLGLLTDEEASLQLTGKLPPKGFKPLTGTMFKSKSADNATSADGSSNNGSALNKAQKPTDTKPAGQNNKADPQKTK